MYVYAKSGVFPPYISMSADSYMQLVWKRRFEDTFQIMTKMRKGIY